jgi:hypothetical protein
VRGLSNRCATASIATASASRCSARPGRSEIYRSDEIRPAEHAEGGHATDPAFVEMLGNVHQIGMDPIEVAGKVVAAIKANRFYIFSHPEFKDELKEVFDQILAEFPDEAPEPHRLAFEKGRRDRYRERGRCCAE